MDLSGIPDDVALIILGRLDAKSLARVALTSSAPERNLIVQTLLLRSEACGVGVLVCEGNKERRGFKPPHKFSSWAYYLAWLEQRREDAHMPVAAGRHVCFFAANGGKLTMYGSANRRYNESSLLGLGIRADIEVTQPTTLPSTEHIQFRSVSCGYDFGAAVSVSGQVYTWGTGRSVQYPGRMSHGRIGLGHADGESRFIPSLVPTLTSHRVLSVATGYSHCIAVTETGEVFSWGIDEFGQCGHGAISRPTFGYNQPTPKRIQAMAGECTRARNASAGKHHSIIVTETGSIYSFGRGTEGALGHGDRRHVYSPKMVRTLDHVHITSSASGDHHTLAVATDGSVFSWGDNVVGELGTGTRQPSDIPARVCGVAGEGRLGHVRGVAATLEASCAVTFTGELFAWGAGTALGHGAHELATWGTGLNFVLYPMRVEALRHMVVEAISIRRWENGESQALVVTNSGSVYGWGWGTQRTDQTTVSCTGGNPSVTPCLHSNLTCLSQFKQSTPTDRGELYSKISYFISTQA